MKLIVITPSKNIENEHVILKKMLAMGLPTIHVRKPALSRANLKRYLNEFTKSQRKKIVIHTHASLAWRYGLKGIHLSKKGREKKISLAVVKAKLRLLRPNIVIGTSCRSLSSLHENYNNFTYLILSPIFTDPHGHRPSFNPDILKRIIPTYPGKIIAHGGATIESINKTYELGFTGIAFQGYLWDSMEPLVLFQGIIEKFNELGIPIE